MLSWPPVYWYLQRLVWHSPSFWRHRGRSLLLTPQSHCHLRRRFEGLTLTLDLVMLDLILDLTQSRDFELIKERGKKETETPFQMNAAKWVHRLRMMQFS